MKIREKTPPRIYEVGLRKEIQIKDCGQIELEPDEQVTFVTPSGAEYDLTRKSWGFYATPSLNARLKDFGLRAVLVKNLQGRFYVLLAEKGREPELKHYLDTQGRVIICWLDEDEVLQGIEQMMREKSCKG